MKNNLIAAFSLVLLFACGKEEGKVTQADKFILTFYLPGDSSVDSYTLTLEEKEELATLSGIFQGEKSPEYKCGYTGKIKFMMGENQLIEGEFNLDSNCRHIAWMDFQELRTAKLSDEVFKFLESKSALVQKKQLEKLKWFVGKWEMKSPKGTAGEVWNFDGNNLLSGNGFEYKGSDTTFSEKLSITSDAKGVYYIPELNDQAPVKFKLTRMTENFVVFENPAHDFPTKISYEAIGDSGLVGHIQGTAENGKTVTMDFPYKKIR